MADQRRMLFVGKHQSGAAELQVSLKMSFWQWETVAAATEPWWPAVHVYVSVHPEATPLPLFCSERGGGGGNLWRKGPDRWLTLCKILSDKVETAPQLLVFFCLWQWKKPCSFRVTDFFHTVWLHAKVLNKMWQIQFWKGYYAISGKLSVCTFTGWFDIVTLF